VTASDIAYTNLLYENTKEVWEEDLQIKASSRTDEERHNAMHHKKNQVSCRKGKASQKVWQWLDKQWTIFSGSSRNSSQVMHGIHFKIIGKCIKRNIMPEMIIKLRNYGNLKKNVRQVAKMTGK
jgi:hypothetical protein